MQKTIIEKEAIIAEYLTGESSYRQLGTRYGIDFRMIHSWVMKYQGKNQKPQKKAKMEPVDETPLPSEVQQLQRELRRVRLHNKLLNAMIDIAEDQLKIDIRKKSGARQ